MHATRVAEALWRDVRLAVRQWRRNPLFAATAVVSLALGIGANTAIFTLFDQILIRPLPVRDPGRLVFLSWEGRRYGVNMGRDTLSYPMYADLRDKNEVFSDVFCRSYVALTVTFRQQSERADGELVSGNYFNALGVGAAIGRTFVPDDDRIAGGHPLAVLSYDYWINRHGGDPRVVGQTLTVNGHALTIVGVSARGFSGVESGFAPAMRIPVSMKAQMTQGFFSEVVTLQSRRAYWVHVFARLKPDVSPERAYASLQPLFHSFLDMEVRSAGFATASAETRSEFVRSSLGVHPAAQGRSPLRRDYGTPLQMLMTIVGVVLLIACANVANLLLARVAGRQREYAVRRALGARRFDLARQQLVESLLLAGFGGAAGLFLAVWIDKALLAMAPGSAGGALSAAPDPRVLTFTLVVCLVTGLLFGLAPALTSGRSDLVPALKEQTHGATSQTKLRRLLVVAQVSLSILLLIGAALFLRSLINLRTLDAGLRTENIVAFSVNPRLNGYSNEQSRQFYRQLLDRLPGLPGVESAGAAVVRVLDNDWWGMSITPEGAEAKGGTESALMNIASASYFRTLGTPLLAGRTFEPGDAGRPSKVAIVNETFARRIFPGMSPIGRRFGMGNDPGTKADIEIVGVVGDAKYTNVRDEIRPQGFLNLDQHNDYQQATMYVKTRVEPRQMYAAIRRALQEIDPNVPPFAMRTMDEQRDVTLATDRLVASLALAFGLVATLLAAVGLYGLMAFTVAQRTREIGLRMALGAPSGSVMWLVMKEVALLVGIGTAVALPAAWALAGLVRSQLYGITPNDPASMAAAALTLALVAALAGCVPASRAARIDPMRALRCE